MSAVDVLALGSEPAGPRAFEAGALARAEARRILRSPAIVGMAAYAVIVTGFEALGANGTDPDAQPDVLEMLSRLLFDFPLVLLGPITFVAANLVASSAKRAGSDRLLSAVPVSQRRRDLALCLAVLTGPTVVACALAGVGAWSATGVRPALRDGLPRDPWLWTNILQQPAIVLGAGILGIAVARWLPIPGAPVVAFLILIFVTGWLAAPVGPRSVRPWLAPYVLIDGFSAQQWLWLGSQTWHLAYLLGLSGLGVCAVGLRQPERRGRWLGAGSFALAVTVTAGVLQLPRPA